MSRSPNQFIDPLGAQATYNWPINHLTESPRGRKRMTTAVAPTGGIGTVRQQGSEPPLQLVFQGTILTEAQRQTMIFWWVLCRTQTIIFNEFDGETFEVIITDYEEQKIATDYNRNDPTIPFHYYTYTITMDVITSVSGGWSIADPNNSII